MAKDKGSDNSTTDEKSRRYSLPFEALLSIPGFASQTIGKALGQSGSLLGMLLKTPEFLEQAGKAGRYLKDIREVAGLTLDDLTKAVDLKNPDILKAIEEGRSPITLDILFRLASFYSRNDPFSFMFNFSREYAPWLWQALRITGMEKLLITMERELKFINIYRARESARNLSDENFDKMLGFVRGSFDMAMDFIEPLEQAAKSSSRKGSENVKGDKPTADNSKKAAKAKPRQATAARRQKKT